LGAESAYKFLFVITVARTWLPGLACLRATLRIFLGAQNLVGGENPIGRNAYFNAGQILYSSWL